MGVRVDRGWTAHSATPCVCEQMDDAVQDDPDSRTPFGTSRCPFLSDSVSTFFLLLTASMTACALRVLLHHS